MLPHPRSLVMVVALVVTATAFPRYSVAVEHFDVLRLRAQRPIDPDAVLETECVNIQERIIFHDETIAELGICGGLPDETFVLRGSTQSHLDRRGEHGHRKRGCVGDVDRTEAVHGTAQFRLLTEQQGAFITLSKQQWDTCVRAARAVCPTGSFASVCRGGATFGNVVFQLQTP